MKPLALRRILVATDLTPAMHPALRSARTLADLSGAELHVVHSIEDGVGASEIDGRLAETVAAAGGELEVRVLTGPGNALITQEAARTMADVIILGRHRNRAGRPGTTADRVVRTAQVPCLILPTELSLPLASVVVPVDVTEAARGELAVALTWTSALRRRSASGEASTRILALHVRAEADAPKNEPLQARLHSGVAAIRSRFAHVAGVDIEEHVEAANEIAEAILATARTRHADLIVLGTRGERIDDDPLGSVSSAVVGAANLPVLLVPPEVWRRAGDPALS